MLAADDASVEGWYLMGWAWWLVAERTKAGDTGVLQGDDGEALEWQDMASDARDCLETCRVVRLLRSFLSLR